MRILIIPARGGSKGIPRKNLRKVNGVSLIDRAIRTALKSNITQIIVSTDDHEIREVAKKYNVTIHNRSRKNSGDRASTESVIQEIVKKFDTKWNLNAVIGFYQVTSPFVEPETINKCFQLAEKGFSAFSATEFKGFVWRKGIRWKPTLQPIDNRPRRQDLEETVIETGAIYAFPLAKFKKSNYRFCSEPVPVKVEPLTSLEIDDKNDLLIANFIASQFEKPSLDLTEYPIPKIIFTDFDGCLTNDHVLIKNSGKEYVTVNRKDGLAVKRLRQLGIDVIITSGESNNIVLKRASKLGIEALIGLNDKKDSISAYLKVKKLSWHEIWYVGNDVNDLGAIENAAMSFCPIDASPEVFSKVQIVLSKRGGEGLLAEIASMIERSI